MTQDLGSNAYEYSNFDIDIAKNLKTLLNYICKKTNDYEEDAFSDIFGENTINFKELPIQKDEEKPKKINIFSDEAFISKVTNPIDIESYEKNNLVDNLTQMAIYARIVAGIKCCDEKYIDLEGLKAAFTVLEMDFNPDYGSVIEEKLYKIKNLDIKSFKNS